ncbi:MAG: hypothetical protein ACK4TO_00565 [Candidatus Nitrosotenuis sp.]
MGECISWYNTIKPHGTLDLKTPVKAYYEKRPQLDALVDPSLMERGVDLMRNDFRKQQTKMRGIYL